MSIYSGKEKAVLRLQRVRTYQEGATYEPEIGPPPLDTKSAFLFSFKTIFI
jgi:hypothetical protein